MCGASMTRLHSCTDRQAAQRVQSSAHSAYELLCCVLHACTACTVAVAQRQLSQSSMFASPSALSPCMRGVPPLLSTDSFDDSMSAVSDSPSISAPFSPCLPVLSASLAFPAFSFSNGSQHSAVVNHQSAGRDAQQYGHGVDEVAQSAETSTDFDSASLPHAAPAAVRAGEVKSTP